MCYSYLHPLTVQQCHPVLEEGYSQHISQRGWVQSGYIKLAHKAHLVHGMALTHMCTTHLNL